MNREQFLALFGKGMQAGSTGAEHALDQQSKLAQLIKGKQVQSQLNDEQRQKDIQSVAEQEKNYPGREVKSGTFTLGAPKDNTLKNAAENDRLDKLSTQETQAVQALLAKTSSKDVDKLKGFEEINQMLQNPNTMNKMQLRMAIAKANAAGNKINLPEIQGALGPETWMEKASDLYHSATGIPEDPFSAAQIKTMRSNLADQAEPIKRNVQNYIKSLQTQGQQLAPYLHRTNKLGAVMSANIDPITQILGNTDFGPGSVKPPGAGGANAQGQPPQKPSSVIQNGHTYNLNPQTGEYE